MNKKPGRWVARVSFESELTQELENKPWHSWRPLLTISREGVTDVEIGERTPGKRGNAGQHRQCNAGRTKRQSYTQARLLAPCSRARTLLYTTAVGLFQYSCLSSIELAARPLPLLPALSQFGLPAPRAKKWERRRGGTRPPRRCRCHAPATWRPQQLTQQNQKARDKNTRYNNRSGTKTRSYEHKHKGQSTPACLAFLPSLRGVLFEVMRVA